MAENIMSELLLIKKRSTTVTTSRILNDSPVERENCTSVPHCTNPVLITDDIDKNDRNLYRRPLQDKTNLFSPNCGHHSESCNTDIRHGRDIGIKRRQIALDRASVEREIKGRCSCITNCYDEFTVGDVLFWRQKLHCFPEGPERMTKLIELLKLTSIGLKKNERAQKFRVDQKMICRQTMIRLILKVSTATFSRAKAATLDGRVRKTHVKDRMTNAVKGKICEGFIRSYISSVCDRDPTTERYRMPSSLCRNNMFSMYENQYIDHLQKSQFYKILKDKFKDLSFNKTQRLTKCTQCADYVYLIETEKDPFHRSCLEADRNAHIAEQQLEREAYYVRRAQAEMRPNQFFSLIIDGMDQNKTDLPHYVQWNNPNGAGTEKLRTHVTGSIVHGRSKYCFVDFNEYQHNTNLTLSCLLNILLKESKDNRLPPTLYVQLDNTTRENKNKYFLGFISYLVKKKIFCEAYISFLLVGHTHEDVDQMFSKISHSLKKTDAVTKEELHNVIRASQQPSPVVEDIHTVWNISEWLEPCINQVHNVTFPKMYRIYNDDAGHTTVKFKGLSTDPTWRPLSSERPLEIFKLDENMTQMIPEGHPNAVVPKVDEHDWEDLKRSIQKDCSLAKFTNQRAQIWSQFLENPFEFHKVPEWPGNELSSYVVEETNGTLGEKEKELIEKYKKKRDMLKEAEFSQSKIRIVEHSRRQVVREQEKHAAEKTQILNEMQSLKELLNTYEQSIERKDQVISNLTHAMQKQREKIEMLKKFNEWKLKHIDRKREIFAGKLAANHYERRLSQKVWDSWHSLIVEKWRSRVEKACQAKAQEVCINLTNDYESRIRSLTEALEASREEVAKLHQQRECYEETMKKAFMRGVCALNLEAMTMFQPQDDQRPEPGQKGHMSSDFSDNLDGSIPVKDFSAPKTIPQEPVYTTDPRTDLAPPKIITSQGARPSSASSIRSKASVCSKTSTTSSSKGKHMSAKITAKTDSGRGGVGVGRNPSLDPPMSSVIVERHPPVNKETIGQATAGRHPRQTSTIENYPQTGILHRRIAGQSGAVTISPNVQTVKVVD